jgi:glycosyltransferase involved in cell wall biosynthesis
VLTVSSFSRDRIAERLRIPQKKIVVAPGGVSSHWQPADNSQIADARKRHAGGRPYVLSVGSLEPRKNLRRLLAAWQHLGARKEGVTLLVAGTTGHVFRDAGLDPLPTDVRPIGFVSDDDLRALFSGAEAFVFPSLYEGFGLPVLEAMACGAPVICSRAGSLPEVAGDAALLVDPLNSDAIADGLQKVLANRDLRADLRERGLARAAQFSWDATAEQIWNVLTTAI